MPARRIFPHRLARPEAPAAQGQRAWHEPLRIRFALVAVAAITALGGCATAPFFRPNGPPLNDKTVELGIGPHVAFGQDDMGVGTGAWMHAQFAPDVELILRGHGTNFFKYAGTSQPLDDILVGGSGGVRGVWRYRPTLLLGVEGLIDYQVRTVSGQQLLAGIVGLPIAEEAMPGLWVYTCPSGGIAIPLEKDAEVPFFGFQEIPIGISWQATDWLVIVAEGGFSLPLNGGYGGAAAAFRF